MKKDRVFTWGIDQECSYRDLQEWLVSTPILAYPDFTKPFTLQKDASNFAVGEMLSQINDIGDECPVTYISRAIQSNEIN